MGFTVHEQLRTEAVGLTGMDETWTSSAHTSTASTPKDASPYRLCSATASRAIALASSHPSRANVASRCIRQTSSGPWSPACKLPNVKDASLRVSSPTTWRRSLSRPSTPGPNQPARPSSGVRRAQQRCHPHRRGQPHRSIPRRSSQSRGRTGRPHRCLGSAVTVILAIVPSLRSGHSADSITHAIVPSLRSWHSADPRPQTWRQSPNDEPAERPKRSDAATARNAATAKKWVGPWAVSRRTRWRAPTPPACHRVCFEEKIEQAPVLRGTADGPLRVRCHLTQLRSRCAQ